MESALSLCASQGCWYIALLILTLIALIHYWLVVSLRRDNLYITLVDSKHLLYVYMHTLNMHLQFLISLLCSIQVDSIFIFPLSNCSLELYPCCDFKARQHGGLTCTIGRTHVSVVQPVLNKAFCITSFRLQLNWNILMYCVSFD